MIPILYDSNETAFVSNGLCRLRDCFSCVVTEERNGIYELDFEYPVNGANFEEIQCGRIIAVTHEDSDDIQPFDIVGYTKPINGVVTFHAVHISYRLRGYVVEAEEVRDLTTALEKLETASPANNFIYEADFTSNGYAGAFNGIPRTVRQLLGGVEGSILDTYGGEYEFDKFRVILHKTRGTTADFKIRYGLNMVDYNEDLDYSETYTTAIPYWVGADENGNEVKVLGNKVSPGYVPYNGFEKCVPLDLSDKFETAPTAAQLESYALSRMRSQNPNLPKQSIKVDFIRLNDFEEFSNFKQLLQCRLCDSIEVIFPYYQTSGFFKIVRTEYDVIQDRFLSMELGTLSTSLAEALGIGEASSGSGTTGGGSKVFYGTCSTSADTAVKQVVCSAFADADLVAGAVVYVDFTNSNTASNPTLNVNSTGAKAIMRYGGTVASTSAASSWNAGAVVCLIYDGTYWNIEGWLNTTYSGMTDAEYQAGTSTTNRLITPARLKDAIQYWAVPSSRTVNGKALSSDISLTASDVGAVSKAGDTMTGQLKTSFQSSVAMGSYGASATTVPNLVEELRFSSGCMGSASISTAYTANGYTIATGWYNFIYSPHRNGGENGQAHNDNCNFGNLFLLGMNNTNGQFIIRVSNGAIAQVIKLVEENTLANYATTSSLSSYALKTDLDSYIPTSAINDYITSQGSTNGWYWRKYKSKKCELWKNVSQTVSAYAQDSFILGSNDTSTTKYPFTITSPITQAYCRKIGTGGGFISYDYDRTDYWSGIAFSKASIATGTSMAINYSLYVRAIYS